MSARAPALELSLRRSTFHWHCRNSVVAVAGHLRAFLQGRGKAACALRLLEIMAAVR